MFLIAIISVIVYIVAIISIYHNIYNFEKTNKIKFIVIGCIIMLVITMLFTAISSSKIDILNENKELYEEYLGTTKTMSILLFAPINAMILLPYIGSTFNKYTENILSLKQVKKRLIILCILLIVIAIFEVNYIKDFQMGILVKV